MPGGLNNTLAATALERDTVPFCWLPADLSVVGEADLDVRTAAVLLAVPELVQAVNSPLLL